jgi:hypothetical protein
MKRVSLNSVGNTCCAAAKHVPKMANLPSVGY